MNPRQQMEDLLLRINHLNDQKSGWQKAWEIERDRQHDPNLEKPPELLILNKQLGPLYGMKEDLLREHPYLENEYGGKKRRSGKSPLGGSPIAQLNKAAKKMRYLANREVKRLENRQRAQQRGSGRGSGKK